MDFMDTPRCESTTAPTTTVMSSHQQRKSLMSLIFLPFVRDTNSVNSWFDLGRLVVNDVQVIFSLGLLKTPIWFCCIHCAGFSSGWSVIIFCPAIQSKKLLCVVRLVLKRSLDVCLGSLPSLKTMTADSHRSVAIVLLRRNYFRSLLTPKQAVTSIECSAPLPMRQP